MIWEGTVTTSQEIFNFPHEQREEVRVYTDADLTVKFWRNASKDWGEEIEIKAPGAFLALCGSRGLIEVASAKVVII